MEHRTCQGCGNEFAISPRGQHAKYCSRACRNTAHNARRREASQGLYEPRTCQHCKAVFTPTNPSQRYCPPTEEDRARQTGQATSKCARRASNAQQRGEPAFTVPDQFDCAYCGKHCKPGHNGLPAHASRFCTKRCKQDYHRGRPTHRQRAEARLAEAAEGTKGDAVWYFHSCSECGDTFLSKLQPRDDGRFCSPACGKRSKRRRRRARKAGAGYKTLSFHTVAARDQFTCQLCGHAVDMDLQHPHRMAPTLDHIVPLRFGGSHTEDNAQLAHMICNSSKGDGVSAASLNEQLALV